MKVITFYDYLVAFFKPKIVKQNLRKIQLKLKKKLQIIRKRKFAFKTHFLRHNTFKLTGKKVNKNFLPLELIFKKRNLFTETRRNFFSHTSKRSFKILLYFGQNTEKVIP